MDENRVKDEQEVADFFDNLELLSDEDVENMNFFEACYYLEKLNMLDEITSGGGDQNE
jgi:hypothetical protein